MRLLLPILVIALAGTVPANGSDALFTTKILPILEEKCGGCHGEAAKKIKGGFDMRTLEGLLRGGESGQPALAPGKPEESPLFLSVTWQDPDLEMPPKENDRLNESQITDLRTWIEKGAPWPEARVATLSGSWGAWTEPDRDGLVRVVTSGGQSEVWTGRGYDPERLWAFKARRPVGPPTDGHPIDAFIDAKLAEEKLGAAPRADASTLARRLAYTLTGLPPSEAQKGKPYEALLDELLASPHYGERMAQEWLDVTRYADSNGFSRDDERPEAHRYRSYVIESFNADKPYDRFVKEQIAGDELGLAGQEALAFLWMGPWEMTAMTSAAVARQMWLDDVVNSIGVTFLGQELRCAKCHDHKFDPIPTRDYYALHAVFAGTRHHVNEGNFKIQSQKAEEIAILRGGNLESPTEKVRPGFLSAVPGASLVPTKPEGRRAALAVWIASAENPLTARVIVNRVWQWHFGRGIVSTPNAFGVIGAAPSHPELLDWLAGWFVENGWSVRKLNRLILTSAAFQRSTAHPDWEKVRTVDPDGIWLASFRPRRLTAEEIRDSMLVASGELTERVGGPGFRAEINWEVAFQPRLGMGQLAPPWQPDPKREERHRRSLYAMRIRNLGHPLMEVLNRPSSEFSCERRDETTVVTQAFSLFHGEFTNARALAVANRAARDGSDDLAAQIERVFQRVLARAPLADERARAVAHVEKMRLHHRAHPPEENPLPTEVTLSNIVEKTGEPASTTFQLDQMKVYERDLQPWEVAAETRALAELALVLLNSSEFLHVY